MYLQELHLRQIPSTFEKLPSLSLKMSSKKSTKSKWAKLKKSTKNMKDISPDQVKKYKTILKLYEVQLQNTFCILAKNHA